MERCANKITLRICGVWVNLFLFGWLVGCSSSVSTEGRSNGLASGKSDLGASAGVESFSPGDHELNASIRFEGNRVVLDYQVRAAVMTAFGHTLLLRVDNQAPRVLPIDRSSHSWTVDDRGDHVAVLQLVDRSGAALRLGDHRKVFSFERIDSGLRESVRRLPFLWVLSPRGTIVQDGVDSVSFDFVYLPTAKNERIRYRLRGETRELTGEGAYKFKGLGQINSQGSFDLEAYLVDGQGRVVDGPWSRDSVVFEVR